jgi:hypothetical protein
LSGMSSWMVVCSATWGSELYLNLCQLKVWGSGMCTRGYG